MSSDTDAFTYETLCEALDYLMRDYERPGHYVYVGPPFEGDYPPPDWIGWWCPEWVYDDRELTNQQICDISKYQLANGNKPRPCIFLGARSFLLPT